MLQILSTKAQKAQIHKVNTLLNLFKIYQGFTLSEEEKAKITYIIAEDDQRGIYGGAILYPRENTSAYEDVKKDSESQLLKVISDFQEKRKEIWNARICLCIGENSSPSLEDISLCESFYDQLYQILRAFQKRKRIGLLSVVLKVADTYKTTFFQNWLFLYEIKFQKISNGFFYGILDASRSANQKQLHKVLDFTFSEKKGD